jgi:hypothetical protein
VEVRKIVPEDAMKKTVTMVFLLFSLWGCSNNNQLTIQNQAQGTIYINFRASIDSVYPGGKSTLTDIPNGSYNYNTTFELPSGVTSWAANGSAASGQMTFDKKNTQILLLYSSTTLTGVYTVYVNESSTDPVSVSSPTSAQ